MSQVGEARRRLAVPRCRPATPEVLSGTAHWLSPRHWGGRGAVAVRVGNERHCLLWSATFPGESWSRRVESRAGPGLPVLHAAHEQRGCQLSSSSTHTLSRWGQPQGPPKFIAFPRSSQATLGKNERVVAAPLGQPECLSGQGRPVMGGELASAGAAGHLVTHFPGAGLCMEGLEPHLYAGACVSPEVDHPLVPAAQWRVPRGAKFLGALQAAVWHPGAHGLAPPPSCGQMAPSAATEKPGHALTTSALVLDSGLSCHGGVPWVHHVPAEDGPFPASSVLPSCPPPTRTSRCSHGALAQPALARGDRDSTRSRVLLGAIMSVLPRARKLVSPPCTAPAPSHVHTCLEEELVEPHGRSWAEEGHPHKVQALRFEGSTLTPKVTTSGPASASPLCRSPRRAALWDGGEGVLSWS
ncbi:hypothetical protein TREES_T100008345 [Tupaia chinensis]|uniref:Uncharacterized protein n=1 Tax=Tupaia chinensis TaxID=246437 RepID=L9LB97_TUPCH|nr:hypothetical protein TREES_T100008345 [Tupaia chinensis]